MKLPPGHVPGLGVRKATAYGGFGEKLLRQWGWEKGQGCGKNKQGISEAVQVKKKDDNNGIGANTRYQWDEKWWEAVYNSNADSIKNAIAGSDSDDSDSDSDHEATTVYHAKQRRNRDGTLTSASAVELKIASSVAKDARGWAGRFGGREGKMERIRRQELQASELARRQLGLPDASPSPNCVLAASSADEALRPQKSKAKPTSKKAKPDAPASMDRTNDSPVKKRKAKGSTNASKKQKLAGGELQAMKTEHVFKPLPADWWGHKYFVAAGALESLEQSEEAKKRQMFCEDDQEALYNRTQDNKVAARQGLGVRGSAIKIAGGEFQGKKIKFDGEAGEDGHEDDTVGDVASLDGIKWKKLIAKTLRGEPSGNMKVRKLQKRVAAAVLSQLDAAVCVKRLESVVLQKLTSSSRFVVEGKVARCCC